MKLRKTLLEKINKTKKAQMR